MKIHATNCFAMYTSGAGGGCVDIANVQLIGFTLVKNDDLARLRQVASCMDDDPIPQHIMEVIELCTHALRKTNTQKAKDAMAAIKDLLKGTSK